MAPYPTPTLELRNPDSAPSDPSRWVRRVFRWQCVDSTNEAAFRAMEQGAAQDGDAFVASEQTQGRGRRGNKWCSEPGLGLYASFAMYAEGPFPGPMATITAGLACQDAVESLGLAHSRLKWPNDLLVGQSKLAGILVESREWSAERPIYVIGVGLNVAQLEFPDELNEERSVVSLAQLGLHATLDQAEEALFSHLGRRLQQARLAPAALARDFVQALGFEHSAVQVQVSNDSHHGRILSLDFTRGLEIATFEGNRKWIPLEHIRSVAAQG